MPTPRKLSNLSKGGYRKLETTPRSTVRSALRMLWLKSRERSAALKRDNYQCSDCHIKQSKKKGYHVHMEVDHLRGTVDMDKLIDLVFKHLLVPMSDLETVCNLCHRKRTAFRAQIGESATL